MKKTKTTEITIETEELFVIKKCARSIYDQCERCGVLVQMVTLAEAACIARVSELVIYEQMKTRFLHWKESPEGQVHICLSSLLT